MIFFIDSDGATIRAFEDDGSQDYLITDDMKPIGESEAMEVLASRIPLPTKADIEQLRLAAYANPITGSDRMFAEVARMQLMVEDGFESVREGAIARYEEIRTQHPWTAE